MNVVALKKHSLSGKEVGTVNVDDAFLDVNGHRQMIKDYIVAIRKNARQWSANTLGRSEVAHTTKKPHRQKGTGSARQGNLVTPQFRGGGIVFGPKPKFDQHVRINRKERKLAMRTILAEKIKEGQVIVLEDTAFSSMKAPKTKTVASFLKDKQLFGRKVLFVGEGAYSEVESVKLSVPSDKHDSFKLSMRNIPRAEFAIAANVNGYEMAAARAIIMTESAFAELKELLS